MQTIPLQAVPSQQLQIILGGQNCQLAVYMRGEYLFADLNVAGADISTGVIARNTVNLVPTSYLGFVGFLMFLDTMGQNADPTYTGLGARFQLLYITQADFAALGIT